MADSISSLSSPGVSVVSLRVVSTFREKVEQLWNDSYMWGLIYLHYPQTNELNNQCPAPTWLQLTEAPRLLMVPPPQGQFSPWLGAAQDGAAHLGSLSFSSASLGAHPKLNPLLVHRGAPAGCLPKSGHHVCPGDTHSSCFPFLRTYRSLLLLFLKWLCLVIGFKRKTVLGPA